MNERLIDEYLEQESKWQDSIEEEYEENDTISETEIVNALKEYGKIKVTTDHTSLEVNAIITKNVDGNNYLYVALCDDTLSNLTKIDDIIAINKI